MMAVQPVAQTLELTGLGNKVRITDMKAPVLIDAQRQLLEYTNANPMNLTADAVVAAAMAQTGLNDLGDGAFRPRLDLIMSACEANANLSAPRD